MMISNEESPVVVATCGTRAAARERGTVLLAKGIDYWTTETPEGFVLMVAPGDVERAATQLRAFEADEAEERIRRQLAAREPAPPVHGAGWPAAVVAVTALVAVHFWRWRVGEESDWLVERWCRDGERIFSHGEWWRALTALVLHEDGLHLAGNLIFGVAFMRVAARDFGPWLAWGLAVAAGGLGNLLTAAAWLPDPYRGIGASTAVFAAVGLLVAHGMAVAWASRRWAQQRAWLLPLGGGLALLGLFGSGGEHAGAVDLAAHLFGFVAGLLVGIPTVLWQRRQARQNRDANPPALRSRGLFRENAGPAPSSPPAPPPPPL